MKHPVSPLSGVLLVLSLFLVACGNDPVQQDLMTYVNTDMQKIDRMESVATEAYASVSGENYSSDKIMYNVMTTKVIPNYTEFLQKLKAVKPKTKEVQDVHSLWVQGAELQMKGFSMIVTALEKQDADLIQQANGILTTGGEKIVEFRTKLNELAKVHQVTITKD